ncbi:MAG TPA: response regulator [Anaerolineales bacterium]|nr:response regulator [Anaerolineales bacterium]
MSEPKLPISFVIEDDKNLSVAFTEAMKSASYQVITIRNGLEAIARLKTEVPATIILDLHIPGVTGVDILHYLRDDARFKAVKVIVVTADDRKAEELRELADLVLIKPIGLQQLRNMALRLHPDTLLP